MAYYYKTGVLVPFVQKFYKQMIVVVAGLFIASMGSMTFSASAATTVVSPGDMQGWAFAQETATGSGSMVNGPDNPPLGTGSANLEVDAAGGEILAKAGYNGLKLSDIAALEYSTYRTSGGPALAIALQFNFDGNVTDANNDWQGRIVYEPYHTQEVTTGTWQTWDALDDDAGTATGNWWFTNGGHVASSGCAMATPCTWAEVKAAFTDGGVHNTFGAVVLKAGSSWAGGFDGNVDALTINTDVYNFELTDPAPDTDAPTADLQFTLGATYFDVVFSEPVDETQAETASNYYLNNWPGAGGTGDLGDEATVEYDALTNTARVTFTQAGWFISPEQEWRVYNVEDLAGNVIDPNPTVETSTAMVAPDAPGVPTTASPTMSTNQTWAWTAATDPGGVDASGVAYYEVSVDGGAWTNIGNVLTYETNFTNGTHTLGVRAIDNAGNLGAISTGTVTVFGDKDDCKNGGWALLGTTFKNQGQCVSHFASNGASTNARNR